MRGRKRRSPLPEHLYLTPDLWREILLRLPVKTLLRFRSVCKTWCSFIDSPDFISMHDNFANTYLLSDEESPNFTIRRSDTIRKTGKLVKLTSPLLFEGSDLINAFNGLLLMRYSYNMDLDYPDELSLWNPCIKKFVLLPPCPLNSLLFMMGRRFLLGFDSNSNDYKVLGLQFPEFGDFESLIDIAIYSLNDHSWRVKPNWVNVPRCWLELIRSRDGVVFCQGALYWSPYSWLIGECTHLLSFDFDAEEFSFVKMPDIGKKMLKFCFLLDGSLALLGISSVRACVWVMEKNAGKELWRLFSSGDSKSVAYSFFRNYKCQSMRIMYIENSGTLLVHKSNEVMFYNITDHQVKCRKSFQCSNLITYVESLVLHKGYEGVASTSLT